jgi:hypothetical protein
MHASRIPNKGRIPNKNFRVQTGRISSWTYSKADVYRGTTVNSDSDSDSDSVSEFGSWKPVISAWEPQMKGGSQWGQEPLDKEAEDATQLGAATNQRSEERDGEHWSMCDNDL